MVDSLDDEHERQSLIRELRQHLESLRRAGLDRIPVSPRAAFGDSPRTQVHSGALDRFPVAAVSSPVLTQSTDLEPERPLSPTPQTSPSTPTPRFVSIKPGPVSPLELPLEPSKVATPPAALAAPSMPVLFGESGFDGPPVPACDRPALLDALAREVSVCRKCPHLAETRTQTVFGTGPCAPRLMFVGEAPGADEDRVGKPFVGRAGQLLTDMITKGMGLTRDQVYIANVLKCRPPGNRTPDAEEASNCFPYLEKQIEIIRPDFLCLLGRPALQAVMNTTQPIGKMRGKWFRYRGIPTIATYHPSYLLRTPSAKKDAWDDLQLLMKEMGLVRPRS